MIVMEENKKVKKNKVVKYIVGGAVTLSVLAGVGVMTIIGGEIKRENKAQKALNTAIYKQAQKANVTLITEAEAKQIALDLAGVTENQVKNMRVQLDIEDDRGTTSCYVYEISFNYDHLEYEFEINAQDKTVINTDIDTWHD